MAVQPVTPYSGTIVYSVPIVPPAPEPWLTQLQIAKHFGYSPRWVRFQMEKGMPHQRFGGRPRYRISECEKWFEKGGF